MELEEMADLAVVAGMAAAHLHELRNQLTVIRSHAQMADITSGRNKVKQHCKNIVDQVDDMEQLLDDIFYMCRGIDQSPADTEPVCVLSVFNRVKEQLSCKAEKKQLRIDIVYPKEIDHLTSRSAGYLRSALFILTDNAVSAAPSRGNVVLSAWQAQDNKLQFIVEDDGPGISPEMQDKIFEPYYTTKPTGTGMGLFLAKFIVKHFICGQLEINSYPGCGTRATILLNLEQHKYCEDGKQTDYKLKKTKKCDPSGN